MGERQHLGLASGHPMSSTSGFSENDIRPRELMAEKQKYVDADLTYLLSRHAEFVEVACPACDSGEEIFKFEKLGFSYCECLLCGTLFMNPRPSHAVLRDFYATSQNYQFWNRHIFPATEAVRRDRIFRPRAERLSDYCRRFGVTTHTLLEVGAGFGTFCEEMRSLNLFERIVAVEPSPDLARTCRARRLEVFEMPIGEISASFTADVIASFEVIEHLFSPYDFIMQCASLLKPGGLLVITCPNYRGFDIATLKTLSNSIDHEHLNYFHTESLPLLLQRCGFDLKEVQTPGTLDAELVRKHVLSGALDLNNQPLLWEILVERWPTLGQRFQDFLAANCLSSHMWVAGMKTAVERKSSS